MCVCVLNWLDAKKRAGLIGPDANKKTGTAKHRLAGGGGGGAISAEGGQYLLADYVRGGTISASRLCPGGQNLRGDRICSDTGLTT